VSTLITIDLDALEANYRFCREQMQPVSCAAVVKADAYGLGLREIAPVLRHAGCRQFFTATHREGVTLVPVLISPAHSACWAQMARSLGRPLPAIIHIDTGMTRLGFGERELHELLERPEDLDWLDTRYIMTHFACADEPGEITTHEQLDRFNRLHQLLPPAPTSIGNSAGGLLGGDFSGDMARIGIALFGGNPYQGGMPPLKPVLRVQSRILQLREISEGTTVGYGATYRAKSKTRIATVGTGYADGYPWSLGNHGIASIGGHRVPVVGRVSMDLITLDVTGIPDELVQPGCMVDLIGPDISLEEVAERAGTINYEILTRLGQRARRKFLGGRAS